MCLMLKGAVLFFPLHLHWGNPETYFVLLLLHTSQRKMLLQDIFFQSFFTQKHHQLNLWLFSLESENKVRTFVIMGWGGGVEIHVCYEVHGSSRLFQISRAETVITDNMPQ